ncbi:MAG: hypothetical protein KatS3mg131_0441 [Candidatus Tectimicrobiota bacterium]|nr:MAG: hypothetical protein KatS3mg131_0441 [Candidatus Tectomicrobia bacterium]
MTSHSVSVYAGAARWNSGATRRCGLFRKAAAEAPWQPLAGLPQDAEVRAIAVHPRDPRLVFAGTQYGPYRSQDGGDHWEKLPFPDANAVVWSLCFHPTEPKRLYLGTAPAAVYCSDDGGERWQRLAVLHSSAVVTMDFPTRVVRLVFHPQRPNELYAGLEVGGVMRSLDGGATPGRTAAATCCGWRSRPTSKAGFSATPTPKA